MIPSASKITFLTTAAILLAAPSLMAQHGHLNVGVYDTDSSGTANNGDQLGFKNGNDFAYDFIGSSGYISAATTTNIGNIAIYYGGAAQTWVYTPVGLSGNSGRRASINATTGAVTYQAWETFADTANGTLDVAGADAGSFLRLELVSVTKLGGSATSFSFWGSYSAFPSFSGTTPAAEWDISGGAGVLVSGSNTMDLTAINTRIGDGVDTTFPGTLPSYPNPYDGTQTSEGFRWNVASGDPVSTAVDPFGHIHGRQWAVNGSANLRLEWRAVDANGKHGNSDPLIMRWTAVPEPAIGSMLGLAILGSLALRRRWTSRKMLERARRPRS
jgi:hypothetical protein